MNFSFIQVITASIGGLLIFAAIKNQTPVAIIQGAMGQSTGKDFSGGGDFTTTVNPSLHGFSTDQAPAPVATRPGGTPIYIRPNAGPF